MIPSANMNPPHGEKSDFRKITVTIPPGAYEQLIHESARRKIAGERIGNDAGECQQNETDFFHNAV